MSAVPETEIDKSLVGPLFGDHEQLTRYAEELFESELPQRFEEAKASFRANVAGAPSQEGRGFGAAIGRPSNSRLYALMRAFRPGVVVETGVCNGISTAIILLALSKNETGRLYSIDQPRYFDPSDDRDRQQAVVPPGKGPGWVAPERLRDRWELTLGPTREELPRLLDAVGTLDAFHHDSEHSYECMTFEYEIAFDHLSDGGLLISDDTTDNTAFADFAASVSRPAYWLGNRMAVLVK